VAEQTEKRKIKMSIVSMKKLLENGVHFGHQTRRWDPKAKPFIYAAKNGSYIIDLAKSQEGLETAYKKINEIAAKGGKVLFVGTKKQAQQIVMDEAIRSGSFYINQRWLGGTLTNFRTIQKSIKKLIDIETMEENGSINVYPKKEVVLLKKKAARLENFIGGIKEMKKVPDAVIVIDPKEDFNAVAEAKKLGIPVFGFADTNCDPALLDYPIPANDDAIKAIKLLCSVLADAIIEPKGGLLQDAYQEDQEAADINMKDVILNVQKQHEENERRRRQRMEERRNRSSRYSSEKRNYKRNDRGRGNTSSYNRNTTNRSTPSTATATTAATAPKAAPTTAAPVAKPVKTEVK
jgi:small subunit ribosomal protein S2